MSSGDALQVRPMRASDLPRIMEIEHALKDAPQWSQRAWQVAVDPKAARRRIAIVAEESETGTLQGFAVASVAALEAELESIGVAAAWQRRGIARRMLTGLTYELRREGVQEFFLEVRASNQAAHDFYSAMGFTETGRRDRYYADPEEDAVLMVLRLGDCQSA